MALVEKPGDPSVANLTRREFIGISALACASGVSPRKANGFSFPSEHFLTVNLLKIPKGRNRAGVMDGIQTSLSRCLYDAIVVSDLDDNWLQEMVECRSRINAVSGIRRLLVHRPLNATSVSKTLEQIHRDSEMFRVDGWDLYIEDASKGQHVRRRLELALELISRTPLRTIGIVLPEHRLCGLSGIEALSDFVLGFSEISFVILRKSNDEFVSKSSECARLEDLWSTILMRPNVYVRSEISQIMSTSLKGLGVSGSQRVIWGRSRVDHSFCPADIRTAVSKLCMNGEQRRRYFGLNAARVYSLCVNHYQNVQEAV
jgi:hypothetical protein